MKTLLFLSLALSQILGATEVVLNWTASVTPGTLTKIEHKKASTCDGATGWTVLAADVAGTTWTHTSPPDGDNCYRIFATKDGRTSIPSNTAIASGVPPQPHTGLTATTVEVTIKVTIPTAAAGSK